MRTVLPTAASVAWLGRKRQVQAATGRLVVCTVCRRSFAQEKRGGVTFGRWPAGFVGGPLCSMTCRERAVAQAAKAAP